GAAAEPFVIVVSGAFGAVAGIATVFMVSGLIVSTVTLFFAPVVSPLSVFATGLALLLLDFAIAIVRIAATTAMPAAAAMYFARWLICGGTYARGCTGGAPMIIGS